MLKKIKYASRVVAAAAAAVRLKKSKTINSTTVILGTVVHHIVYTLTSVPIKSEYYVHRIFNIFQYGRRLGTESRDTIPDAFRFYFRQRGRIMLLYYFYTLIRTIT